MNALEHIGIDRIEAKLKSIEVIATCGDERKIIASMPAIRQDVKLALETIKALRDNN